MAGDEDVTLGELARRFDRFERSITEGLANFQANFVTAQVWQAEKRILEDQRTSLGREIADLKSASRSGHAEKVLEHKELHLRIDNLTAELAKREREKAVAERAAEQAAAKEKAQRVFTLITAAVAAILSLASGIALAVIINAIGV
jgi:septal ring factor EnvC (AmiA/AmiB activator)